MQVYLTKKDFSGDVAERKKVGGFSIVELLTVVALIGILSAISVPYIFYYRTRYRSEDQTLKVMDLMREAGQLAVTRRRTYRLEIDKTSNQLLIIDENQAGAADDTEIKAIPLDSTSEVRMDIIPTGATRPNPPNYADAVYATDTVGHQRGGATVTGDNVWAARFNRDGTVVDKNNNPVSATLYVFPPQAAGSTVPRSMTEVRAITIFGGSGAVRYWKNNGSAFVAQN